MQTVEIRFDCGENEVITFYNGGGEITEEEQRAASYIKKDWQKLSKERRQDKILEGYTVKGKRVEIRRKPTVWERAADFLSGFDIVDVLLTAALLTAVIVAARW